MEIDGNPCESVEIVDQSKSSFLSGKMSIDVQGVSSGHPRPAKPTQGPKYWVSTNLHVYLAHCSKDFLSALVGLVGGLLLKATPGSRNIQKKMGKNTKGTFRTVSGLRTIRDCRYATGEEGLPEGLPVL